MKATIIKNTIIVLITSLIIKLLSLFNRVLLTRFLGQEGISIYSLILPTIMLFLSFSTFSLNTSIVKVTAVYKSKQVIKKGILIAIITSSISSILLLIINRFLSNTLLKQPTTYFPIICSIPLFYLTSISTTLRGYLTGINKISKTSTANLIEQVARILFTICIFVFIKNQKITFYVMLAIIAMSIGELFSILFSIKVIKKCNDTNTTNDNLYNEIMKISIPTTFTSILSNITFFLEPIIYTYILSKLSFTSTEILYKYSEVTAYSIPLITLFSFIPISISTVLMPKFAISKKDEIKLYIEKIITICLCPAFLISTILFYYSNELSILLYNTNYGSTLISKYVWFFIFFYLISPFNAILQSTNQSKKAFTISLIVHALKLIFIIILPFISSDGLMISYLLSYFFTFVFQYCFLKKQYKFKIEKTNMFSLILITIIINLIIILLKLTNINYLINIIIITLIYLTLSIFIIFRNNK